MFHLRSPEEVVSLREFRVCVEDESGGAELQEGCDLLGNRSILRYCARRQGHIKKGPTMEVLDKNYYVTYRICVTKHGW